MTKPTDKSPIDDAGEIIDCMARMKGDNQPFALATVVRTLPGLAALFGTFWTRVVMAAIPLTRSGASEESSQ